MRLATYNIASGGFANYESISDKPERLELLQKAIRNIDADIIGLTDTFRWKDIFTSKHIEKLFDYPYSYHIDMNDARVDGRIGVAVLSRHPIIAHKVVRLHNRDAIKATVELADSNKLLDVFVLYLDDLSESTRQKQVQALNVHHTGTNPTIVMGDFNAVWPQHVVWTKQQVDNFIAANPDFKKRSNYKTIRSTFNNFMRLLYCLVSRNVVLSNRLNYIQRHSPRFIHWQCLLFSP